MTNAIEVAGLTMSYGRRPVLRGVDFDVRTGEVFCLLGPNGAGKTTTVEILEGFRRRTGGTVRVLGRAPAAQPAGLRERIGIVLQECGFPRQARVAELLDCWRGYYANPRDLGELLEVVGLTEERNAPVRRLSGGQRRRLDRRQAGRHGQRRGLWGECVFGVAAAGCQRADGVADRVRLGVPHVEVPRRIGEHVDQVEALARVVGVVAGPERLDGRPALLPLVLDLARIVCLCLVGSLGRSHRVLTLDRSGFWESPLTGCCLPQQKSPPVHEERPRRRQDGGDIARRGAARLAAGVSARLAKEQPDRTHDSMLPHSAPALWPPYRRPVRGPGITGAKKPAGECGQRRGRAAVTAGGAMPFAPGPFPRLGQFSHGATLRACA